VNHQSNHQGSRTDATTDRAGATSDQEIVSADGPGAAAARTAPDPEAEAAALAAEIAVMAAEGPHLITSHGDNLGRAHRRCSCKRGTPPAGALTAETAETFVAKCRAAAAVREEARERAAQPRRPEPTSAAPVPADPGAGTDTPGTAETISALRIEAVLDVLAPVRPDLDGERMPIFELAHEETPGLDYLRDLAGMILARLDAL
jgi:hypothetical protein